MMIMKKNILSLLAGILAISISAGFVSCNPKDIEPETLYLTEAQVSEMIASDNGTLYNLDDFVAHYMTEVGVIFPVRSRSFEGLQDNPNDATNTHNRGWFSIDTIPSDGPGIYIRGRIVTDDYDGNFYKSLVIQQVVNNEQQALRVSVDASSVGGQFAKGQEIIIRVNGLSIGKYANEPQLCVPSYNDNIYANKASEKVGWAPGRIPVAMFMKAAKCIGLPDQSKIYYDNLDLATIAANATAGDAYYHKMDGHLVRVENVHFHQLGDYPGAYVGGSDYSTPTACTNGNPVDDTNSCVFAPTTENQGFPQGRIITDGTNYCIVSTSEFAKFAHMLLPTSDYVGTITGILGHYTDNAKNQPDLWDWSITVSNRNDIVLSNGSRQWSCIEWFEGWNR